MFSAWTHSKNSIVWWMAGAVCVAIMLSAGALVLFGRNERGLDAGLMLTGRWAFLLFWSAYAGAGVSSLVGGRLGFLRRKGREFGLAFAAAMLVHVGLITWLCAIGAPPAAGVFAFFGVGLLFTYALALFSLPALQQRIGRRSFWLLRTVALNYIAYAFATDFLRDPMSGSLTHVLFYAPFAFMSLFGFAVYARSQMLSICCGIMAA